MKVYLRLISVSGSPNNFLVKLKAFFSLENVKIGINGFMDSFKFMLYEIRGFFRTLFGQAITNAGMHPPDSRLQGLLSDLVVPAFGVPSII